MRSWLLTANSHCYSADDSWPSRLDPRGKLLGLVFYSMAAFLTQEPLALIAVIISGAAVWLASRLSWRVLFSGLKPMALLATATFLFHASTTPGAHSVVCGPFTFSTAGAWSGCLMASRLLAAGGAAVFVIITTRPLELMEAGVSLLSPLELARVRVQDLSLLLGLSLRFIPLLAEETERISWAQKARGMDWEKGPLWRRLVNRSSVIFPLLVGLFRRSEELAVAMEARGYRRGKKRTLLYSWHWRWTDWLAVALGLALLGVSLYGRWRLP